MVMKGRAKSASSQRWLQRQHSDYYVRQAKEAGYRSRAAYKLLELQQKDRIFRPGMRVVDLGAAPGGWSQVAKQCIGQNGRIVALDILPIESINGVDIIQGDFQEEVVVKRLLTLLREEPVDLVISDMAPNLSGIASVDQAKAIYLAEIALDFAKRILKKEGVLLVKLFQGLGFEQYVTGLKRNFDHVFVRKPKASRAESREVYLLAKGYLSYETK